MKTFIVTEGETDRLILSSVLNASVPNAEFSVAVGGGKSSAISLARSLLETRPARVALVVDADTSSESRVREEISDLTFELNGHIKGHRASLFLAVPEIERWLFEDAPLVTRIFGRALTSEESVRSRFEPKKLLQELISDQKGEPTPAEFIARLPKSVLRQLGNGAEFQRLREFIEAGKLVSAHN